MSSENKFQWVASVLAAALTLIVGVALYWQIFMYSPYETSQKDQSGRQPSSLQVSYHVSTDLENEKNMTSTLFVNCIDKYEKLNLHSESRFVRLSASSCVSKTVKEVKVENKTSNVQASTFLPLEKRFTSDLIDLTENTNAVTVIVVDQENQEKVTELTIERSPASSSK